MLQGWHPPRTASAQASPSRRREKEAQPGRDPSLWCPRSQRMTRDPGPSRARLGCDSAAASWAQMLWGLPGSPGKRQTQACGSALPASRNSWQGRGSRGHCETINSAQGAGPPRTTCRITLGDSPLWTSGGPSIRCPWPSRPSVRSVWFRHSYSQQKLLMHKRAV